MTPNRTGLIALFANHRVAANLLMALMFLAGGWALTKLNTQFFPNFELDLINVRVVWSGASAEDVETGITRPLEQELRSLDYLHKITSTSATGVAAVTLEYDDGTDMNTALEKVNSVVGRIRNLPDTAEKPEITRVIRYESIARVLVTSDAPLSALRQITQRMRDELLERGISRVDINGLPDEELAIEVATQKLLEIGLSLDQIGQRIFEQSRDIPVGTLGKQDIARQLRSLDQRRSVASFETLPINNTQTDNQMLLGDIATIQRRAKEGQLTLSVDNKTAVELQLFRSETADSLGSARVLENWLAETRPILPKGLELKVVDQSWVHIKERIMLLLTNGGGGLLLIIGILLLFLKGRVAFWVTIGIPTSFMATLAALYLAGGSINMISLFGLIMALGIIVDDAIVVGEDSLSHFEMGEPPVQSAEGGARRMLAPVMSSSLTTIAAFIPLMLVGGVIGNIMSEIPLVIICVIIASLVECFFILPGHLRGTFTRMAEKKTSSESRFHHWFDNKFDHFRNTLFRKTVTLAIENRHITLASSLGVLILCIGLVAGGRIGFTFFPSVEGRLVFASVAFTSGSPAERAEKFLAHLRETLKQTEEELGNNLINTAISRFGSSESAGGGNVRQGDNFGSLMVEMISPEQRSITNKDFIAAWRKHIQVPAGIETFTISERRAGPPGRDIDIRLTGDDANQLKLAATDLITTLSGMAGVSAAEDDLPWGQEQLIYHLTPTGRALGLDTETVALQLRAAFDGHLVQLYQDGQDEVEVRVMLPQSERQKLSGIDTLQLILPDGNNVPLISVVDLSYRRGFDALRHSEGRLAVSVSADVDRQVSNSNVLLDDLSQSYLPQLRLRYGVDTSLQGRAEEQRETLADLRSGAVLAFLLMYITLAWVFASYSKPLVVMTVIPFGLVGAIVGHWIMNLDLTVLSLFGFFGLSGIVVNDSIILVTFYQKLRSDGIKVKEAIVEAACQRLRAVLLTSLTTIAGLTPLLFETSLQAKFLIPMATTISFGLAFATLLVLVVVPALIVTLEDIHSRFSPQPQLA